MVANTITGDRIQAGSLDASKLTANTITALQIAANAISALAIQAGTITADKLQAGSITAAQIASTTITAIKIATGTITAAQIAGGTITGGNIAGLTIQGNNILGGTITGDKIGANQITAAGGQIAALTVNTLQLAGHAVTVPAGAIAGTAPVLTAGVFCCLVCSPAVATDGTFPFVINAMALLGFGTETMQIMRSTVAVALGAATTGVAGGTIQYSEVTAGSAIPPLLTMWLDSPPAGTYFYVLACKVTQSGRSANVGSVINVLGVKK